jgi:hypothetical protein
VIKAIDLRPSFAGKKGEVFSLKDRFYEVLCVEIEIVSGSANCVLSSRDNLEEELKQVVASGDVRELAIASVAVRITPVEICRRRVVFAVRREKATYSLHEENGSVVLGSVDREALLRMGISLDSPPAGLGSSTQEAQLAP